MSKFPDEWIGYKLFRDKSLEVLKMNGMFLMNMYMLEEDFNILVKHVNYWVLIS